MTLSISAYLDTLAQHRTRHASPSPLLALSPHLLLVLAALHSVGWLAWVHVRARRDRKRSSEGLAKSARRSSDEDERAPLLSTSRGVHAEEQEASEGLSASGWELVLEAVKVLVTVALFGLSLAKLTGYDNGKWELVLEGGIIGLTAYLTLSSAAKILNSRVEEVVRQQQIVLSLALVAIELAANIEPFAFIRHPHITLPWRIAFAQTVLSILMGLLLLLTPPRWTPRRTNVPPNPAQTASPLSVLFFSFLEFRMFHYYLLTSPRLAKLFRLSPSAVKNVEFRSFVPPLPDVLHSEYVLSRFRWEGDSPKEDFDSEEERKKAEGGKKSEGGITMGTAWQFAWHQRWEAATIMAFASGWIVFIFLSPLSMNLLLRYVQSSEDPPLGLSPYVFVLGVFFAPIASSVCFQSALYRLAQLGLRLRSLLGHAVYAKLLRVMAGGGGEKGDGEEEEEEGKKENGNGRQKGRKQSGGAGGGNEAIGRVNNLVGTDVDTITSSLPATLQLYGVLPKLVISLLGLELLLGWSAFVSLAVIIAFIPVSRFVAGRYGAVQGEIMKATDRRITIVQELLNSIRIVKTFAWEKASMKRIEEARDTELERIIKRAKVYAGMMFLSTGIPAIVTLSTFGAYVFGQGETLTASTAFTAMSLFGLLREAVISATFLLSSFMRARVSLERITHFIADTEELDSQPRTFTSVDSSSSSSAKSSKSSDCTDAAIVISANSQFRFSRYGSGGFTLSTASNDSTKELRFPRGRTTLISGDVGSGKSAMLLALLGELHVKVGGIEYRIEKNATEVDGKKGARKENGRVKLSYAGQNPWLQDDSIRANILFGEEFDEERYNQTVFACSLEDDLDNLPKGDETRVGEKGLSLSGGQKQRVALARAIYSRSEIVLLDDVLSALDSNMVSHVVEHCLNGPLLENRTVVLVTHFVKLCVRRVENLELVIHLRDGKVTSAGPPSNDLAVGGSGISRSPSHGSMRSNSSRRSELHQAHVKHGSGHEEEQTKGDSSGEGSEISWDVYKRYAKAMGGWTFWLPYAVVNILAHVFMLGQGWFIGRWVNAPDAASHAGRYFALYAAIQVISSISLTAMYLALIWGAVRASRKLYDDLTKRVFAAPFRWWDRTPLGNVVNRNSKDTEILDTEQVENLQPVLDYSVQVLFVAIIIAAILPIFFIPASLIFLVFFLIANLYIRSALAARKQVSSSRSPLFSTLGDTTSGVTTIRAFGREQAFAEKYKKQTDEYNRAQLYEEGLDRWLEERSDTVGAAVSFVVGILCLSSGLSSGVTGFLISTGLEFTSRILYVVRAVNKNELSLNSVQRILQYSGEDVPVEEAHVGKKEPPAHWPSEGGIEFDDFSARYSEDGEDVLHSLTLSIKPGEKIGIVGPSGCGKSSLSLALLRFIITSHGSIRVDGRELNETNLDAIRSRMTLVPQDPTLFSGSLRSNLDPNDEHDDSTLWNAIKRSGFIQDGSSINLDSPVSSGGANFSQGQRQLVSLARALVRNSRILILDEATASLDDKSDEAVQRVVREEFAHATNLVVAHRLDSVIDFDRILVLRAGRIVEFDAPLTLLDREDSLLRELVDATGRWDELCAKAKKAGGGK